jgi:hypothetical protein
MKTLTAFAPLVLVFGLQIAHAEDATPAPHTWKVGDTQTFRSPTQPNLFYKRKLSTVSETDFWLSLSYVNGTEKFRIDLETGNPTGYMNLNGIFYPIEVAEAVEVVKDETVADEFPAGTKFNARHVTLQIQDASGRFFCRELWYRTEGERVFDGLYRAKHNDYECGSPFNRQEVVLKEETRGKGADLTPPKWILWR